MKRGVAGIAVVIALLALARVLAGPPGSLFAPFGEAQTLAAVLRAAAFLFALAGWGELLLKEKGRFPWLARLLAGSLFLAAVPALAGALGLLGASFTPLFLATLIAGGWGWARIEIPLARPAASPAGALALLLTLAVLLVVARMALFLPTLRPQLDVYSYDLYAPWRWWTAGAIRFDPRDPHLYLASYWEYLFTWAFPLFGDQGNALFGALLFSQLVNAALGFGGTLLGIACLLRFAGAPRAWAAVAACFGATVFPVLWTSWTAKNDYGAIFYLLGALAFLVDGRNFLFGLFSGAAFATKATSAFCLAFAPLVYLAFHKERGRHATRSGAFYLAGAAVGLLPHLLRNQLGVGNPVFPLFLNVLPSPFITATMRELVYGSLGQSSTGGAAAFLPALARVCLREPVILGGALLFGALLYRSSGKLFRTLYLASLLPLLVEVFWLGSAVRDDIYLRYLAPSLCLLQALPVAALGTWAEKRGARAQLAALVLAACAFVLLRAYFPWEAVAVKGPPLVEAYRAGVDGGRCKLWLAEHVPADARVFSVEDYNLFLLPHREVRVAVQEPELDTLVRNEADPEKLTRALAARGFQWVYHLVYTDQAPLLERSPALFRWMAERASFRAEDCAVMELHGDR